MSFLQLERHSPRSRQILHSLANHLHVNAFVSLPALTVPAGERREPFLSIITRHQLLRPKRTPASPFWNIPPLPTVAALAALPDLCSCPVKIPHLRKSAKNCQPSLPSREIVAEPSVSRTSCSSLQEPLCLQFQSKQPVC